MTPAEQEFIALWHEGLEITVIAQRLGIPKGTVQSRAHRLQARGLIRPRPKGGAYPRRKALARQDGSPPPVQTPVQITALPPYPRGKAVRWNVWILDAMRDELATWSAERGVSPSQLVQELLWKALTNQLPSTS
jgi:DNA-binding transcriptional MocR family regulator